jgi:hypothetical protein
MQPTKNDQTKQTMMSATKTFFGTRGKIWSSVQLESIVLAPGRLDKKHLAVDLQLSEPRETCLPQPQRAAVVT